MRVLIVEDEFVARTILRKMLSVYGECDVTSNGKDGINAFISAKEEGSSYSLVCLDIQMQHMSGHETLAAIRELESGWGIADGAGVKVIMTSGLRDSESKNTAFSQGCEAYITKPLHRAEVLGTVKELGLS